MAAFCDNKDAGGNFPEASHSATTPTTSHPLDDVVPVISPLSEPSLQVITPRPHLFSSLEEAHLKITSQSREGSRQVSGEIRDSESRDDSFLMSLSPSDAREIYTNVGFPIIRTSSYSQRPLLDISDSEDDNARIGASDLGVESEAEAENRLSVLQPPPERMHSARRQGRGRRSFIRDAHMSASRTTTGESDNDDPFKYDDIFPEPSKEREVSLYLHQVSGFGEDEAAFTYSPDKTPLGSIGQSFNGEAVSPTEQRLIRSVRSVNMAPAQGYGHNTSQLHIDSPSRGHDFFESGAINPEWTLGSPDAVRVPVRQSNFVGCEAPVPVFVPEQRTHRVNGLFQNSSRPIPEVESFKPQYKKRSPSFGQMVSGAIRQPFRRGSSKRPLLEIPTLHEGHPHRHPFTELCSEDGHEHPERGIELIPIAGQAELSARGHAPPNRQAQIPPAAVLPPPLRMPQAHFDNRDRGDSLESSASASLFDPGRVELLPLDVAQRMQALRRASGQEDQTLTGRERLNSMRNASYTTDASQAGSQPATPSSVVTPDTGKVKRFVPRAFAHFSSPLSGRNDDDTDGKASGSKSPEIHKESQEKAQLTRKGALIAGDDTRPTVSTVTDSDVTITTIRNEDGSQYRVFDPAPRLYPWDHRHRRAATQKSTDQSLQRMAYRGLNNPSDMERGTVSRPARNTEHWLSDEAQARRRGFFLIIALLGLFPFFSLLAIAGTLDGALSWHTRGEVDHFTSRQKSFLLAEFLIIMMAIFAVIFFIAFSPLRQH
ncbi:hypothetical protein SLS53_004117 [Cytospora paraplurivora]|uniref:Uncharacterized protein n=1 Tax=Cytospora paraplurivora TaxID=2898453 RepID=A0AAN9YI18_9PEZI